MGMNTVIVISNDRLHDIESDPTGFISGLREAINGTGTGRPVEIGYTGAHVISVEHNSHTNIILTGDNTGRRIGGFTGSPRDENAAEQALRELASRLGYKLTKK